MILNLIGLMILVLFIMIILIVSEWLIKKISKMCVNEKKIDIIEEVNMVEDIEKFKNDHKEEIDKINNNKNTINDFLK